MSRFAVRLAALAAVAFFACDARAQDYPNRPVNLMVPSVPGGATDVGARLFADVVGRSLGQRVIVDNKQGAGGIIAAEALTRANPDGYTLLLVLGGMHEVFSNMQAMPFDAVKDFLFITSLFYNTTYVIVPGDSPANKLSDMVDLAKKPGGLNFGLTQIGSPTHLLGALFKQQTGVPVEFIPYRGATEMTVDLVANRLDFGASSISNFQGYLAEKKIKMLAINSPKRSTSMTQVPTLAEAGFPGMQVVSWFGVAAPVGTPPAVVNKLLDEFGKASRDPELVRKMNELDLVIQLSTPAETTALVAANKERLGKVIRELNIKPQ